MKTIYFYSYSGNNKELAHNMGEKLKSEVHEITECRKRNSITFIKDLTCRKLPRIDFDGISIDLVDKIILFSPIWFGKVPNPVLKFIYHLNDNKIIYDLVTLRGGQSDDSKTIIKSIEDNSLPLPHNHYNYNLVEYCDEEIKDIKNVKLDKETITKITNELTDKIFKEQTV